MGRKKTFSRESVLDKAMPVFWAQGFAGTSLQDLELATGVNKSGLYAEFKDKDDLYLASLQHYLQRRQEAGLLTAEPPGWANVVNFLKRGYACGGELKGCFSVSSMRELPVLPPAARQIMKTGENQLKQLIASNIKAESPQADATALADMILTFFFGICMDQTMDASKAATTRKIDNFVGMVRTLAGGTAR
jgi:AcrR family transcriptional regulator